MTNDLNNKNSTAKYQQVKCSLEEAILEGQYAVGEKLPSERELAKMHSVSVLTLRQALSLLEREGIIRKVAWEGSYVMPRESTAQEAPNQLVGQNVALVVVDVPSNNQFMYDSYMSETERVSRGLGRELTKAGRALTLCYANTLDFAEGRVARALEQGNAAAVGLDGWVEDYHIACMQSLGYQVVVNGNRPIHLPVSRLYYNYTQLGYLVTKALIETGAGPVVLITGPFDVYYLHELFEGYHKAIREAGEPGWVNVLSFTNRDAQELRNLMNRMPERFSLWYTYEMSHMLPEIYADHGWTFADHPLSIVTAKPMVEENLWEEQDKPHRVQANQILVHLLDRAIAGDSPKSVIMEPEVVSSFEDGQLNIKVSWHAREVDVAGPIPALDNI